MSLNTIATNIKNEDCLFLFLTESCNLTCSHCYVTAFPGKGVSMDDNVFRKALDLATKLNIRDLRFTGGEPTIHQNFQKYLQAAKSENFDVGLISNGIKMIKNDLLSDQVLHNISRCWISLYSVLPEKHKSIGGRASLPHESIISYVVAQSRKRLNIGLSVVINPDEVEDVEPFIVKCREVGIRKLRFIPWQPDGRGEEMFKELDMKNYILDMGNLMRRVSISGEVKSFELLSFNNPFDLRNIYENSLQSCLLKNRAMWSITPSGEIFSCCFNAYDKTQKIAMLDDPHLISKIESNKLLEKAKKCRGLKSDFWNMDIFYKACCPIGAISLNECN